MKQGKSSLSVKAHKNRQPAKLTRVINVGMDLVREHWDKSKTLRQNMKTLGLAQDPNDPTSLATNTANPVHHVRAFLKPKQETSVDGASLPAEAVQVPAEPDCFPVVTELERLAATAQPRVTYAPQGDLLFVKSLVDKYGLDFKAMARDHEINFLQHTPKQLAKKYERARLTIELAKKNGSCPVEFVLI